MVLLQNDIYTICISMNSACEVLPLLSTRESADTATQVGEPNIHFPPSDNASLFSSSALVCSQTSHCDEGESVSLASSIKWLRREARQLWLERNR